MSADLRARLMEALKANAYRGAWSSHHDTMQPLAWDADDVVDRILVDVGLAAAPVVAPAGEHQPGENHAYGPLVCAVCGEYGQIRVSIVPERAPDAPEEVSA